MKDPAEEDEGERDARFDERTRELLWEAFIQVILSFQEEEGWDGVLQAVTQAMRDGRTRFR